MHIVAAAKSISGVAWVWVPRRSQRTAAGTACGCPFHVSPMQCVCVGSETRRWSFSLAAVSLLTCAMRHIPAGMGGGGATASRCWSSRGLSGGYKEVVATHVCVPESKRARTARRAPRKHARNYHEYNHIRLIGRQTRRCILIKTTVFAFSFWPAKVFDFGASLRIPKVTTSEFGTIPTAARNLNAAYPPPMCERPCGSRVTACRRAANPSRSTEWMR